MDSQHEITPGVFYLNHPHHRNRLPEKSQWTITKIEERACFAKALGEGWVSNDVGWGLHQAASSNRLLFAPLCAPGGGGPGLVSRVVYHLVAYLYPPDITSGDIPSCSGRSGCVLPDIFSGDIPLSLCRSSRKSSLP